MTTLSSLVTLCWEHIAAGQLPDGSYNGLTAKSGDFQKAKALPALFPSVWILTCLNQALPTDPKTAEVKKKLVNFLLQQRSSYWSFNYWKRYSKEYLNTPYPDDLDDTFCVLTALHQYDPNLLQGSDIAKVAHLLTAVETEEGGPYRTWLVPENAGSAWRDVDLVVNSNIAYFLHLQEVELPKVKHLIDVSIQQKWLQSPYYPEPYPIFYCVARYYQSHKAPGLIRYIESLQEKDGSWGNPLNTSLALSALFNLGAQKTSAINRAIQSLLANPQAVVQPYTFCLDRCHEQQPYYMGSSCLTAAFCLETLARYQSRLGEKLTLQPMLTEKRTDQLNQRLAQEFADLPPELQLAKDRLLERLNRSPRAREIWLFPHLFAQGLDTARSAQLPKTLVLDLCYINLLGWMAYTIYDQLLDVAASPSLLALANHCLRSMTRLYTQLTQTHPQAKDLYDQLLQTMDNANSWEITHARVKVKPTGIELPLPLLEYADYSTIANRSLGECLGPLTILLYLGETADSVVSKACFSFCQSFLLVHQLLDDCHDWEDDLLNGRLTPVVVQLLNGRHKNDWRAKKVITYSVAQHLEELRLYFWTVTAGEMSKEMLQHIRTMETYAQHSPLIHNSRYLEELIYPLKESIQRMRQEREKALSFAQGFNQLDEIEPHNRSATE